MYYTSLRAVSTGEGKLKKEASRDCESAAECLFWSRGFQNYYYIYYSNYNQIL